MNTRGIAPRAGERANLLQKKMTYNQALGYCLIHHREVPPLDAGGDGEMERVRQFLGSQFGRDEPC
jgi:hypothetical protein